MGVDKQIITEGNGKDFPQQGDQVSMEYTGWLFDTSKPDNKGNQFDSSEGRGPLAVKIGTGRVIRGWDEGILGSNGKTGMSLGEKSLLTISSDYAYGNRGFPGLIPQNADLLFQVELVSINNKKA